MNLRNGLVLALVSCVLAAPRGRADEGAAVDVSGFSGSITDVGVQRGPGQVGGVEFRIRGKFVLDHPLDLSRATVVLEQIFVDDAGGLGELMTTIDDAPVVPLVLPAREGQPDNNVFDQPPGYRPHIRLQIQNRNGAFEFRLKLDRGLMRKRPRVCEENTNASLLPTTPITHGLLIDDGVNAPVEVVMTRLWTCTKPGRYHMRSQDSGHDSPPPTPSPVPTATPGPGSTATPVPPPTATPPPLSGDNEPPTASLKENLLRGEDGRKNVVELDGRDSWDSDGSVVRYRFDSGDGRIQDGPDAIARFVYAPGDHRALLQVFDDQGAASQTVSRGFSVR